MSHSDAFALRNSGLNEFLFAEVGSEMNGSPLTILSVLARLGKDPWTEAARLARQPVFSTIDDLASSISQMPLCPQALIDARTTAARLIMLLPSQAQSFSKRVVPPIGKLKAPRWVPAATFLAALAFGIAFEKIPPATPTGAVTPSFERTVQHPKAPTN
jgi:hypothetical protein